MRLSVEPALQRLQRESGFIGYVIARARQLEAGLIGAARVGQRARRFLQPSKLEPYDAAARRDQCHAAQYLDRARRVAVLQRPVLDIVLQPQQYLDVANRCEGIGLTGGAGLGKQKRRAEAGRVDALAIEHGTAIERIDDRLAP